MAKNSFLNDFLETAENLEPPNFSTVNIDYELHYPKLILEEETPIHASFLVDFLRTVKFNFHWNPKNKCMDLCEQHYKRPCKECQDAMKKVPKGEKPLGSRPTEIRLGLIFNHDVVGQKCEKDSGEIYYKQPIQVAWLRSGSAKQNFTDLMEANCEHTDHMDPLSFYKEGEDFYTPIPELLKKNFMMYEENGEDKVWQLIKTVNGKGDKKKTEYRIKPISRTKAKNNLGTLMKIPKEVRDYFDRQEVTDLLPFYLVHCGNVDWERLGLTAPKEGDKFVFDQANLISGSKL